MPSDYFVAIFAHRPTASFASQNCCFFAWFCSLHSSLAHKSNQKEYSFLDHGVAKFATLYYIYNRAVFATLQELRVVLHQEPISVVDFPFTRHFFAIVPIWTWYFFSLPFSMFCPIGLLPGLYRPASAKPVRNSCFDISLQNYG